MEGSAFLHKIPRYPVETAFTDTTFHFVVVFFLHVDLDEKLKGEEKPPKIILLISFF